MKKDTDYGCKGYFNSFQIIVDILNRWQFLESSYIVESEIHIKELFVSIMVKSIGLSFNEFFFTRLIFFCDTNNPGH